MLVSEPVRGRSRATELPCFDVFFTFNFDLALKLSRKCLKFFLHHAIDEYHFKLGVSYECFIVMVQGQGTGQQQWVMGPPPLPYVWATGHHSCIIHVVPTTGLPNLVRVMYKVWPGTSSFTSFYMFSCSIMIFLHLYAHKNSSY